MNIKQIKNSCKLSKEELTKRIAQIGAVTLGLTLVLVMPPISNAINENKAKLEAEKIAEENKEKNINLLSCKVLVENLSDGSVKHHFVNNNNLTDDISYEVNDIYSKWDYEYKGITDKDFIVPYSKISYNTTDYYGYTEIPETNGQYIFDYNVPYYVMDTSDLSLPNGYSLENLYSVNDLKELEAKLDNSIYENKNDDEKMLTVCLFIANIDDYYMCFDATHLSKIEETTNKKDVFALRKCYYIPSIDNNFKFRQNFRIHLKERKVVIAFPFLLV